MSGIIAGGSSLISGIINHFSNKRLSDNAFRQNRQMWNEQNYYNSPLSQVARLREAGLNPALAYGASGGVTGNAEAAPQLDYSGVYSQPLVNSDFAVRAMESMNLASTRALQGSQKDLNEANTISALAEGVLKGSKSKYAEDYALEELRSMRLSNDKVYKECQSLDQTINNLIATRNLTKEQIYSLQLANEFADRTMEYRIEATQLQNTESRKRMQKIDAEIKKFGAEVNLIFEQIRSAVINNSYLPSLLQNNFDQGIESIRNMQETRRKIGAEINSLSVKTGIDNMELTNWFWLNAPSMSKIPGAVVGALTDNVLSMFN